MPESGSREVDALLERKLANFREFQRGQEGVWATINGAYLVSRTMIVAATRDGLPGEVAAHRLMMWQTVLDYQMESFFLLVDRRLNEGLALLRMAAELARDVARISEDEARLGLWLRRAEGKAQRKAYRDTFRFLDSDKLEAYVHQLYDLASTFGIHDHTLASSLPQVARISVDGEFVFLEVPDVAVYRTLEIWLAAFLPLQDLCLLAFRAAGGTAMGQAGVHYISMREAFNEVFAKYRESLRSMDADVLIGLN